MEALTTSDGRRLAYRRLGSGPTLVCHPGGPGSSGRYFGDLEGLDRDLTLVLVDPRGTGGSDRPADARGYRLEEYAADLEELRAHLGLEQIKLLGHSHGGFVAMVYAAEYPERVDRLVLLGTLARFSPEQRAAKERAMAARADDPAYSDARAARQARDAQAFADDRELAEFLAREAPLYFARYGERERTYVESMLSDGLNTDALRFFNDEIAPTFDLRPSLARISAPTLVITGGDDYMASPVSADEIAAGIAGARTVILPNAGHFPFVEAPDPFRVAILEFLEVAP